METNILLLLKQLNISLEQYSKDQMKNLGIYPAQSFLLGYLFSGRGHTVYATELHEKFGISKSAISTTLKRLKNEGYLEMAESPEDDRKKQIILTAKAYAIEEKIHKRLKEQQIHLCRQISPEHLKILESGLHTMIDNIKQESVRRDQA